MADRSIPATLPLVNGDARWKRALRQRLLAWFRRHQRDLPWRRTCDPYQIWVSEIMLQQTQVATVVAYFKRFVATFPSVGDLAAADEHAVLRHWEGLGYYRRARQLHRAAQVIVEEHQGRFPRTLEAIGRLPGVGRYTAGAIASIAFDLPAPILEANTRRLLCRLAGFAGDPAGREGQRLLWQLAADLLPPRNTGVFNQALMELGSLVCSPRAPRCGVCPLCALCVAREHDQQGEIPRMRPKPRGEQVREAAVAVRRKSQVLLRRCQPGQRWAGLWDFLRFPLTSRRGEALRHEVHDKIAKQSGLDVAALRRIATLKHTVTRFHITLDCYVAQTRDPGAKLAAGEFRWVDLARLADYPLSVTGRKLSRLLDPDGGARSASPAAATKRGRAARLRR